MEGRDRRRKGGRNVRREGRKGRKDGRTGEYLT